MGSEGFDEAPGNFTQVKYVDYNAKTKGFLAATDTGNVTVYSRSHLNEKIIQNITCHFGPIMNIAISPDCKNLFTAGKDGTIFLFSIGDQLWNFKEK